MKTLEEIKAHLSETVYDEDSKQRIAGFLIGKEIGKEEGTLDIEFALPKSFDDFAKWFDEPKEEHPNAKVLKDGKWFDITFDEICKNIKDFNPVICNKVLSDDIIENIFDELFGRKDSKYKYTGSERNSLIKKKEGLELIVKENDKFIKNCNDSDLMFVKLIKEINETHKVTLKDIEDKLNETVD